jgi:microcompartment protein CcmL/EutN
MHVCNVMVVQTAKEAAAAAAEASRPSTPKKFATIPPEKIRAVFERRQKRWEEAIRERKMKVAVEKQATKAQVGRLGFDVC